MSSSKLTFNVGIIGGGSQVISFWCPLLIRNCASVSIRAVWSRRSSTTHSVLEAIRALEPSLLLPFPYFDIEDRKGMTSDAASNNLESMLSSGEIDGLIVALPSEIQLIVLNRIIDFKSSRGDMQFNILSVGYPTAVPAKLAAALNKFNEASSNGSNACFIVDEPFKNESAFERVRNMIGDIGRPVGGHLEAIMPASAAKQDQLPSNPSSVLFSSLISYVSLLRSIFGKIKEVNSIMETDNSGPHYLERLCGSIIFENGCVCTINLSSKPQIQTSSSIPVASSSSPPISFELNTWGNKGNFKTHWNSSSSCYVVQRYLHHFEAPTHHPPSGMAVTLQNWLNSCVDNKSNRKTSTQYLADLTGAIALIESKGSNVIFRESGCNEGGNSDSSIPETSSPLVSVA